MSTSGVPPQPVAARSNSSSSNSRRNLPPHLVSRTPPTPSRSPSNASTGGDNSGADREDEEEDADRDSEDESDFHAENDPDDPEASSVALARLGPALATPKQTSTSSPWPFTAAPSQEGHTVYAKPSSAGSSDLHAPPTLSAASQGSAVAGPSSSPNVASDTLMLMSPTQAPAAAPIPASALPHEILLHILRLLPPSSLAPALRVCKAWCQCGVELLWYKPTFTSLPSLYKMLQVLSHPDQTFPYPDFVRRLSFLPLAKEMSDRLIAKLLPCTRLERITLTNCKALSSPAIAALLYQSHRLVALDLSDVDNVDDEVLIAIADNCPRLQGLNLSGCSRVTDRGIEALALKAAGLRRIKLRKCDQLTDVPIMLLSLYCPLLLEIDLAFCTSITAYAVMQLFQTSTALREMSLPGCTAITDEGFPDATDLQLVSTADAMQDAPSRTSYVTPDGAASVASGSRASSAPGTPGSGMEPLVSTSGFSLPRPRPVRSPPAFTPFEQLRLLDLTSCGHLTDAAIAGIVKFCPKLRNLMLGKCSRLTDEALFSICGIGKHLHYLHLGHVNNVTDRAVSALARSCTRLRYVDLANCTNLTDQSVVDLASNLPRLKRIGLVRVNNITDEAVQALAQRSSLERIHLSYCDNLTVSAISSMLQDLQRVSHLSLTGVTAFRKRALQQFCRAPPSNFNDHQRRSFCVFSGRGVAELRKFLKSLSPADLAALAIPDPPSDDDAANFGRHANAMINAAAGGHLGPVAPPGRGNGLPQAPVGQTAAQFAATQARLAQIQQARQTLAIAHQRLQAHQAAAAAATARDARQQVATGVGTAGGPPQNGGAAGAAAHPGLASNNMLGLNLPFGGFGDDSSAPTWRADGGSSNAAAGPSAARDGMRTAPGTRDDVEGGTPDAPGASTLLPSSLAPNGSTGYRNSAPATYAALWHSPSARSSASFGAPEQGTATGFSAPVTWDRSPGLPSMDLDERAAGDEEEEDDDGPDEGPDERAPWRTRRRSTITRHNFLAQGGPSARAGDVPRAERSNGGSDSEGDEEDISMGES